MNNNKSLGSTITLKFKDNNNKEYTLQVKKGNKKPIPTDIWIINLTSSFNYPSSKYCKYHRLNKGLCYALKYELNPLFSKNTLKRRSLDTKTIDYLVKNNLYNELANKLIKANNMAKKHKLKHLRISESGDLKSLKHLVFINNLANTLYNKLNISITIYTHRIDIYKQFKANYKQSKGLIILGSDFKANHNFTTDNTYYDYKCCSNCIECKNKYGTPLCYDLKLKDKKLTIYETLRTNNKTSTNKVKQSNNIKGVV